MINRAVYGAWALVALVGAGCGGDVADQGESSSAPEPERRLIVEGPCDECTLNLEEVAVLGGLTDPVAIRDDAASRDCMVARSAGGDFLVSGLIGGGAVARFQADGTFDHTFGRRGQGPGELGSDLRIAVSPGDSIIVMDSSQGRAGMYDSRGRFSRSFPIPAVSRPWARRADGAFAFVQSPETPGDPVFTILGQGGEPLGTVDRPGHRDETMPMDSWVVSASASGGLWAASMWEYEVFHIDPDGNVDLILERDASWFPAGGRYEDGMPVTVRPTPLIRFIREVRPGFLMVVAVLPDQRWEPRIPPRPSFEWGRQVFDTHIEVVDIGAGRVIASAVTDEWWGAVCDSTLMYTVSEGDDSTLRLRIVEPDP